jgi:hypothetical protein
MRRAFLRAVIIATFVSFATVSVALAGWGGIFGASDLTFTGTYSGAGNADATFILTAQGYGTCINPGSQGPVPGHSGYVDVAGDFSYVGFDQNGNIVFEAAVLSSDGCPNPQWISNVVWETATATAIYTKGFRTIEDTATFTCSEPDQDGHQICTEDGYNGNKYK